MGEARISDVIHVISTMFMFFSTMLFLFLFRFFYYTTIQQDSRGCRNQGLELYMNLDPHNAISFAFIASCRNSHHVMYKARHHLNHNLFHTNVLCSFIIDHFQGPAIK